jgi:hypothetical protein
MKMSTFPFILRDTSNFMDEVYTGPFASVSHGMSNETSIFLTGINFNRHTSQQQRNMCVMKCILTNCIPLHLLLH